MEKKSLFVLRILTGWLMFYAGITKIFDPSWSSTGFLENATYGHFKSFYQIFANNILVDFLVKYGLTLIGVSLITGTFVKLSSFWGIVMMLLFYFPTFPPEHGIVDEHLIYATVFLLLMSNKAGTIYGVDRILEKNRVLNKNKRLKNLLI